MAIVVGLGIRNEDVRNRAAQHLTALRMMLLTSTPYVHGTTARGFAKWMEYAQRALNASEAVVSRNLPRAKRRYPFYCALLYTGEYALDLELHRYVVAHHDVLDRMTDKTCLVFVVESLSGQSRRNTRPINRGEAFDIARALTLKPDQLPAAAVFCDPLSDQLVSVSLNRALPPELRTGEYIAQLLRVMVSSMEATAKVQNAADRLHLFERDFDSARKRNPELKTGHKASVTFSRVADGASIASLVLALIVLL